MDYEDKFTTIPIIKILLKYDFHIPSIRYNDKKASQ